MSFNEKMSWALLLVLGTVGGAYGFHLSKLGGPEHGSFNMVVGASIALIIAMIVVSSLISSLAPSEAGVLDERDQKISLQAERISAFVLAVAVQGIIIYAAIKGYWFVANVGFLGLVLSAFVKAGSGIILYRTQS